MIDWKRRMTKIVSIGPTKIYKIPLNFSTDIEVFLASTKETTDLLIYPEICGISFHDKLVMGLHRILKALNSSHASLIRKPLSSFPIDVLYILRGGLNFNLHRIIEQITNSLVEVSFVSSQRIGTQDAFEIGEDSYSKWSIQDQSILCIGDICATGTTLQHALHKALLQYKRQNKKPYWLLIVTIGTNCLTEMLLNYVNTLSASLNLELKGVTVIYLENVFHLFSGEQRLAAHLPLTDFFRKEYPRTLEVEQKSLINYHCFLERCAIYDGGSRTFEPHTYLENLLKYWNTLGNTRQNISELLSIKTDIGDYELNFDEWLKRRPWWINLETPKKLTMLHQMGRKSLESLKKQSLFDLAQSRIKKIERMIAK